MDAGQREHLYEQLSAYLDDELTDAERREVEAFLAEDPAARALLAELKATASLLRDLPRARAGDELSEGIRNRVERSALLGDVQRLPTPAQPTRSRLLAWLSVAAVLALGSFGVYHFWRSTRAPGPTYELASSERRADTPNATAADSTQPTPQLAERPPQPPPPAAAPAPEPLARETLAMRSESAPLMKERDGAARVLDDAAADAAGESAAVEAQVADEPDGAVVELRFDTVFEQQQTLAAIQNQLAPNRLRVNQVQVPMAQLSQAPVAVQRDLTAVSKSASAGAASQPAAVPAQTFLANVMVVECAVPTTEMLNRAVQEVQNVSRVPARVEMVSAASTIDALAQAQQWELSTAVSAAVVPETAPASEEVAASAPDPVPPQDESLTSGIPWTPGPELSDELDRAIALFRARTADTAPAVAPRANRPVAVAAASTTTTPAEGPAATANAMSGAVVDARKDYRTQTAQPGAASADQVSQAFARKDLTSQQAVADAPSANVVLLFMRVDPAAASQPADDPVTSQP